MAASILQERVLAEEESCDGEHDAIVKELGTDDTKDKVHRYCQKEKCSSQSAALRNRLSVFAALTNLDPQRCVMDRYDFLTSSRTIIFIASVRPTTPLSGVFRS